MCIPGFLPLLLESEDEADQQLEDSVLHVISPLFKFLHEILLILYWYADENAKHGATQSASEWSC